MTETTTEAKIEFLPKSGRIVSPSKAYVQLWLAQPLTCLESKHNCARFHDWIGGYTRPEIILMGFCAGANLQTGSITEVIKEYAKTIGMDDFELLDDLTDWFRGKRGSDRKGMVYFLSRGDYFPAITELREHSEDEMAFLYAMTIASEKPDVVGRLIEIVEHAMEEGYSL